MKQCNICLIEKESAEFYLNRKKCKRCYINAAKPGKDIYSRNYREKNQDYLKAYSAKYRAAHRTTARAHSKLYGPSYYTKFKIDIDAKHKTQYQKYRQTLQYRYKSYKGSARSRQLEFMLTKEQFAKIIKRACKYCGSESSLGIDRIDSAIGYIENNCVSCCTQCNQMKWDYDLEEFKAQIIKIAKYLHLVE